MASRNPTNSDIMKTLGTLGERIDGNHRELSSRLKSVEEQVRYTNGKVTRNTKEIDDLKALNKEKDAIAEAIEKFKGAQSSSNPKSLFFSDGGQKILVAIAIIMTAIGSYILYQIGEK